MSCDTHILGYAKGSIKYDGLTDSKKGWLSGALTIRRDPQHNVIKLFMSYDANPKAPAPSFPLTSKSLEKVTGYNNYSRIMIKLRDSNGTTIMIREGDPLVLKTFHDCLKKIQKREISTTPDFVPYQSHSDAVLKTPNRTFDTPAAKSTPRSEHKYNKENTCQGSEKKFPSSHHGERKTDRSRQFLEKAKEKSGETLELESYKPVLFYNVSSQKSYGAFGMSSGIKRAPGLVSLSAGPKLKKPRLVDACASSYVWGKSHSSSSFNSQAAGLQGFSNLGNTCYMNAILQALFNLETFSADIQNENLHRKMPNNENLFKSLAHLLRCKKAQVSQEKRRAALRQVKSAISTTAKRFSGYEQHDAHEFLNQVLDQLKEEIIKASKPPPHLDDDNENVPVQELLLNPTSMNFEFEIIHTITCQVCHEQVTKTEQFVDLSVDMPRKYKNCPYPLSLQDALDNFLRKEMIEYRCEECGHKESEVTHKFAKLPRVLILHLKRYSYNTLAANYKTARDIDIPKFIALGPHCEEETSPPQPPSMHMTPQKRPPSQKPQDFDAPDGTRRRLDLDAPGGRKFSFKRASTFADSDDDSEKKPQPSKSRADAEAFRVIQESLKEKQMMEEAKRREEREFREAMELSKAESQQREVPKKTVEISNFTSGYISASQLEKMSEEEMIQYAMNQSSVETGASLGDENGGSGIDKNGSDISRESDGPISSCGAHRNNRVTSGGTESESDHHLTGLKKTSGIDVLEQFGAILEHTESYFEGAEEDFLVTDGRPASLCDSDSDKEGSNSVECSGGGAGGGGDNSQRGLNGAVSDAKNSVQSVTVKIKNGPDGDIASYFDEDLDDSVLLEIDKHSDQSHGESGKQESSEKELVVISSAEDDDPFNCNKAAVQSGDIFDSDTSRKRCKSGDPFSWNQTKTFISKKPREHTPERLTLKRQGLSYSKSEQKLKQTSLSKSFGRRAFSAQKYDRSKSYDTWDAVSSGSLKKRPTDKNSVPDFLHSSNSKSAGFDVTDGLASSRKKEPEDKHVAPESSSDDDQECHWNSLSEAKRRHLCGGFERSQHGAMRSPIRYPHDEVDLSCPDVNDLHDLTSSQPKEGCSAPKLTAPSSDWMREYARENEDNQLAAALEKSRTDTGHAVTDFDEEEIQRAIEKSLLEDIEKDENDNEVEVERSEEEYKVLRENAEKGDLPYSYQLTSVVCHLGSSSSAGHYVSDVYDIRKQAWFSYDDSRVHNTNEEDVRASRKKSGYIFFYMNRDAVEELKDFYSKRNGKLAQSKPSSRHSVG
ncbi:ubiquitin carboxyl-terminal hydrolase 37-like isoform X2 [Lineus longissimus]|uniref:ubiquitin carboxyl-terminal hydrolase 37-like isoform X2 n=1 Tax=Lineus longissimus TaxID=88925 RepID=UPI00315CDABE